MKTFVFAAAILAFALAQPGAAQMPDTAALLAEQKAAMDKLAFMDGEWRGSASSNGPMGNVDLIQTERVGPIANGVVRIIEGRGYGEDGSLEFNAVAMITYDTFNDEYVMTSSAQGMTARPWFKPTETGFEWGFTSGPVKLSYEAVVQGDSWSETGYMQFGEQPRQKFLEMNLQRIGDTDWPAEGPVGPE